ASRHNLAGASKTAGRINEAVDRYQHPHTGGNWLPETGHSDIDSLSNAADGSPHVDDPQVIASRNFISLTAATASEGRNPITSDQDQTASPSTVSGRVIVGWMPRQAPHFIVRAQFTQLQQVLQDRPVVVVCGMRGAGKTQLAAAYARELIAAGVELVGWVNAETRNTVLAGMAEIAARIGIADPDGDSMASSRRLRDHLSGWKEPSLLVYDNATDSDLINTLLPTGGTTHVVITSTDRAFAQLGVAVDVGSGFTRTESVRYLEEATGLDDPRGAGAIAAEIGDLPLALSAAAATIVGRRLNYTRYQQLMAAQPLPAVLPRRRGSDHPFSVHQALLLSVQTTENSNCDTNLDEVVRWLLGVMAMLAPQGVDFTMLPDRDGRLNEALARCVNGSLLSWSATKQTLVIHRLVARVLRERAHATGTINKIATATVAILAPLLFNESEAFPRRDEGSRLVDHIESLWEAISQESDIEAETFAETLNARRWATRQLLNAADITRAVTLAYHVYADCERMLGPDHPDTLNSRNNLAGAYGSAGRSVEAIDLYEQNITQYERFWGSNHPNALASRNNLASAYQAVGRLPEAISLSEQNLIDSERILGPDHPITVSSRNNLASIYRMAGRLSDAVPLYEQVLKDREKKIGFNHNRTRALRDFLVVMKAWSRE
ncbi:tetratricopeptide repeat protein, partial [Nocardia jiangsuensis]